MTWQAQLDALLRDAARGPFLLEVVHCCDLEDARLRALHGLSNALMAEPFAHFAHHARTNDVLHVFRNADSGELVGFQFWRTFASQEPSRRFVLGGKLRVQPQARRAGLHLAAGLSVLLDEQARYPQADIMRLAIVSLFGFASIARRLSHYTFVDAQGPYAGLVPLLDEVTRASGFRLHPATGQVDVGIRITPAQLALYPQSYFESPEARRYIERNPEYRSNGCYLAFAFPVDRDNVQALATGTARACLGEHAQAESLATSLVEAWEWSRR